MAYRIIGNRAGETVVTFTGSNTIPASNFSAALGVAGESVQNVIITKAIYGTAQNASVRWSVARGAASNVAAVYAGTGYIDYELMGMMLAGQANADLIVTLVGGDVNESTLTLRLRKSPGI